MSKATATRERPLSPHLSVYRWPITMTVSILHRMTDDMAAIVDRLWAARDPDLPLASSREAVILASIVEKETGIAAERPRIAGVFINRLRRGMRLQSDPTVAYGLTGGGGLGRALARADLRRPSPYNTYVIDALPPGPICNPGRAALAIVEVTDFGSWRSSTWATAWAKPEQCSWV